MAIDNTKTVYVFEQKIGSWYKYNYQDREFEVCEPPILIENYAGIGTRKINEIGRKAIDKLYDDTLKSISLIHYKL